MRELISVIFGSRTSVDIHFSREGVRFRGSGLIGVIAVVILLALIVLAAPYLLRIGGSDLPPGAPMSAPRHAISGS